MKNFWLDRKKTKLPVMGMNLSLKTISLQYELARLETVIFEKMIDASVDFMAWNWEQFCDLPQGHIPSNLLDQAKKAVEKTVIETVALEFKKNFEYYSFVRMTNLRLLTLYFLKMYGCK